MVGNNKKANVCDSLTVDEHGVPIVTEGSEHPRTLAWTYGQSQFNGVTTRYQSCPNYLKIGHYALGYRYGKIKGLGRLDLAESQRPSIQNSILRITTPNIADNTVMSTLGG